MCKMLAFPLGCNISFYVVASKSFSSIFLDVCPTILEVLDGVLDKDNMICHFRSPQTVQKRNNVPWRSLQYTNMNTFDFSTFIYRFYEQEVIGY